MPATGPELLSFLFLPKKCWDYIMGVYHHACCQSVIMWTALVICYIAFNFLFLVLGVRSRSFLRFGKFAMGLYPQPTLSTLSGSSVGLHSSWYWVRVHVKKVVCLWTVLHSQASKILGEKSANTNL